MTSRWRRPIRLGAALVLVLSSLTQLEAGGPGPVTALMSDQQVSDEVPPPPEELAAPEMSSPDTLPNSELQPATAGVPADATAPIAPVPAAPPAVSAPAAAAPQFGGPLTTRPYLTGDWFGVRTDAASQGITFDLSNTQFYQGITRGGTDDSFEYGGRFDYYLNVDGAKAGLWEGFFVQLHGETRYGQDVNFATGGISPPNVSMLFPEPSVNVTALTGVKLTQALSENVVVFAGKLNLLDGYVHPFAAGRGVDQFMNTSLVVPSILARTAPYSTLGAGFAVLEKGEPVLSVAVFDSAGVATQAGFDRLFAQGATIYTVLSIPVELWDRPGHQSFSGIWSSRNYTTLQQSDYLAPIGLPIPVSTQESGSWALLYNFDQYLYVDPANPKRGWGVFGQASVSDGQANPMRSFFAAGIGGNSPIRCRPADKFGIGWYFTGVSGQLKNALPPLRDENGVELYYNAAVTPWFHLTPDLQVIDPIRSGVDSSLLVGLRGKIDF